MSTTRGMKNERFSSIIINIEFSRLDLAIRRWAEMKAVLISTQPKWVEKIASGQKTIEVRKTAPEVPFKAYIYCTKQKPYLYKEANPPFELFLDNQLYRGGSYEDRFFSGKVIIFIVIWQ